MVKVVLDGEEVEDLSKIVIPEEIAEEIKTLVQS